MKYFFGDVVELVLFSGNPAERIMIITRGYDGNNNRSYYQILRHFGGSEKIIVEKVDIEKIEQDTTKYVGSIDFSLMCTDLEARRKIFFDMIKSLTLDQENNKNRLEAYRQMLKESKKGEWE